jgi:hypothetical protein
MVRAYGAEPVCLTAVRDLGKAFEVVRADPQKSIGLPKQEVFDYDAALFKKLRAAFTNHDQDELASLWAMADQFSPESKG